jgi:hypothetical protein
MTEEQIYIRLKELEKVIDPIECNLLCGYISGFLQDYEEALHEINLLVSKEWLKIRELAGTSTRADRLLEVTDLYQKRERIKLSISQLKRMRSDLKERFAVLTYKQY